MSPGDFDAVITDHISKSYTSALHARLRASIAGIESRGRKRVYRNVMDSSGRLDTKAAIGLLASWAFNYNSVEQVGCSCVFLRLCTATAKLVHAGVPGVFDPRVPIWGHVRLGATFQRLDVDTFV